MTGRNPPTPQGIITVNCTVSHKEIDTRKKNATTYAGSEQSQTGIIVYPFGGDDRMYRLDAGEIAVAWRGPKGIDPSSKKINVFTVSNGILIPPDSNHQEIMNGLMVVGVVKNTYDAKNPGTPQNGVAVAIRGVTRIPLNTDLRRKFFPGEFLVVSLPDPLSGPRAFPVYTKIPSQKLLPVVRPLDAGTLKNLRHEISEKAYTGPLATTHLHDTNTNLPPFYKVVHKYNAAIITQFVRALEVAALRGDIIFPSKTPDASESLFDIVKRKERKELNDIRGNIHQFAKKIGLIPSGTTSSASSSSQIPPSENQLQQDIFKASMWPHVSTTDQVLYKPDINYKITPGSGSGSGNPNDRIRVDLQAVKIRKGSEAYQKMANDMWWAAECAMLEMKARLHEHGVGMVLEVSDSCVQDPWVDILTGFPPNIL